MAAIPYGREGKVPEQPSAPSFHSTLIFKALESFPPCNCYFVIVELGLVSRMSLQRNSKFQFGPSGTALSPPSIPLNLEPTPAPSKMNK